MGTNGFENTVSLKLVINASFVALFLLDIDRVIMELNDWVLMLIDQARCFVIKRRVWICGHVYTFRKCSWWIGTDKCEIKKRCDFT